MAVSCFIDASPNAPASGDTITATYSVTGNDGTPPQSARLDGSVVVGGTNYDVSTTITLPAVAPADVTYEVPTCPGLTFVATADPAVFTAVVP